MEPKPTDPDEEPTLGALVQALNYHGAFLKKEVLSMLRCVPGMKVEGEEWPCEFGGKTRTADIVAVDSKRSIVFIIECKKVVASKWWVFLAASDQTHRLARIDMGLAGAQSRFISSAPPDGIRVCSEGYEYQKGRRNPATPEPIFDAANQLSAAFLGYVQRQRMERAVLQRLPTMKYIPLLITNARLSLIDTETDIFFSARNATASVLDGREWRSLNPFDCLILKHPLASPEGYADFREKTNGDEYNQRFHESLYIVPLLSILSFFSGSNLDRLAGG